MSDSSNKYYLSLSVVQLVTVCVVSSFIGLLEFQALMYYTTLPIETVMGWRYDIICPMLELAIIFFMSSACLSLFMMLITVFYARTHETVSVKAIIQRFEVHVLLSYVLCAFGFISTFVVFTVFNGTVFCIVAGSSIYFQVLCIVVEESLLFHSTRARRALL